MIINTETMLAMRCPKCGKLEFHKLSRFTFSGSNSVELVCTCGATKMIISLKKRGELWFQLSCVVCEAMHLRIISSQSIRQQKVVTFTCQETGLELGYMGPYDKIRQLIQNPKEVELLFSELTSEDYFNNSDIMHQVLTCINELAEQGLVSCQCGNYNISIDIFPDRLELQCKKCSGTSIIYAETEEDLSIVQQVDELELIKEGLGFLDSLAHTSLSKKNRYQHDQ